MKQIDTLNKKIISSIDKKKSSNLTDGKMGLCIYFYHLSRWESNNGYLQVAEKLLNDVVNNLSNKSDLSVETGLAGIAVGINHLVKENFVEGDINEILEDVDSRIFKHLIFLKDNELTSRKPELIHYLYYLYLRYTELLSSDDKYIFQELIIKTVEMIYSDLKADFFNENFSFSVKSYQTPLLLYVISKICSLNIYNKRVEKIIEEFIGSILANIPLLQANRLYLLWGILHIKPYLPNSRDKINSHISFLKERIDIEYIMNEELKNQDIYMKDGLSLVYMLLFFIQEKFPEYVVDYSPQTIYNRIKNSEAWNTLLYSEYYHSIHKGLFDGFPGAILVLSHIKKHFL